MSQDDDGAPVAGDFDRIFRAFRLRMGLLLAACFILPVLYFFYVAYISTSISSRGPALALIALPLAAAALFLYFHQRDQLAHGRRLLARGKYTQAVTALARAADGGSMAAAVLLGDIFLTGDGVDQDTEKALEYYGRALHFFEIDCLENPSDTAPDEEVLVREIAGRLEPLGRGRDARVISLLADAAFFLGDKPAALAWARTLPDDGEPSSQAKCLGALLERSNCSGQKRDAEEERGDDSLPDPVKDIHRALWTRPELHRAVFLAVTVAYWAVLYLLNSSETPLAGRDMFTFFAPPLLAGVALYAYSRTDPFHAGQRLAHRRCYPAALSCLRVAFENQDPRAAKVLGDMYRDGLGTEVDNGKALAAYFRAFHYAQEWREYHERDGFKSALFRPKHVAEFVKDPDAFLAWEEELRQSLEAFAACGAEKGYMLLGDFYAMQGDGSEALRCARQSFAVSPTSENAVTLATRLLVTESAEASHTAEGLAILEHLAEAGEWMAASALNRFYSGDFAGGEERADRLLAQRYFREMLDDWRPGGKYAKAFAFHAKYGGSRLLERFGADFLDDDDCLEIMRL